MKKWALLLLVGCGSPPPAVPSESFEVTPTAAPPPPAAPAAPVVPARLLAAKLEGLVLFDVRAQIAANPTEARKVKGPLSGEPRSSAVKIISDEGDVVKITTRFERGPYPFIDIDLEAEGWLSKSVLVPVLTKPLSKTFPDGTAYALGVGLPLTFTDRARPLLKSARDIPVPEDAVGLAFDPTLEDPKLPTPSGAEIGCDDRGHGGSFTAPHVALRNDLLAEESAKHAEEEHRLGSIGSGMATYKYRCHAKDSLVVGETKLGPLTDGCTTNQSIYRQNDGTLLVQTKANRIELVGRASKSSLQGAGGCGSGGLGPSKVAILSVKKNTRMLYLDGTPAGRVVNATQFAKAQTPGVLLCTKHAAFASLLCFEPTDVKEEQGYERYRRD